MKKILISLAIFALVTTVSIFVIVKNQNIIVLKNKIEKNNITYESDNSLNINTLKEEVIEIKKQHKKINIRSNRDNNLVTSRHISERFNPVKAIVTAYAPYDNKSGICNDGSPDTTSTGTKPKIGTLAADPKRIPYGTKIYIEGYGYGIVEDTGGALRSDKENIRIDVFMETYEEAINWGKKEMIIYIIE